MPTELLATNSLTTSDDNRIFTNKNVGNKSVGEMTMEMNIGNYVTGDAFFDRQQEMADFLDLLVNRENVLMAAPRRIGKTSMMQEAIRLVDGRLICLYVDLQSARSAADLVAELAKATRPHESIWNRTVDVFGHAVSGVKDRLESISAFEIGIKFRSAMTEAEWQEKGERLLGILAGAERPVVVMFDELPVLLNRMLADTKSEGEGRKRVDLLMSWLRQAAIAHRGKISFVVAGSIGMDSILRRIGLSATINHYAIFKLRPWEDSVALDFLRKAGEKNGLAWDKGAAERMIELLGFLIPHHVQLFLGEMLTYCRRKRIAQVSLDVVEAVYKTEMLGIPGHMGLDHMEERLSTAFDDREKGVALVILTEASVRDGIGWKRAKAICGKFEIPDEEAGDMLRDVFDVLEYDGYLEYRGDTYVFVSNLLKDWWKNRFGRDLNCTEK